MNVFLLWQSTVITLSLRFTFWCRLTNFSYFQGQFPGSVMTYGPSDRKGWFQTKKSSKTPNSILLKTERHLCLCLFEKAICSWRELSLNLLIPFWSFDPAFASDSYRFQISECVHYSSVDSVLHRPPGAWLSWRAMTLSKIADPAWSPKKEFKMYFNCWLHEWENQWNDKLGISPFYRLQTMENLEERRFFSFTQQ